MRKNQKVPGVTLIEVLIVMTILPLLLILVSSMFGTFIEGQERAVAQAAINQEQQYLLERLAYDMDQATAIVLPASNGTTGTTLRLQQGATTVDYTPSAKALVRIASGNNARVTSTRVLLDSFSVQRLGNSTGKTSVRLTFALSSTVSAQLKIPSREIMTTYTLR